ncbi:MAG: baeRF3 domain-containing protein [Microcella sp.]
MYATTELATPNTLVGLATAEPELAISILLPMATTGKETAANSTSLKNALREVSERLTAAEVDDDAQQSLLAPATALLDDHEFWQNQGASLGVFLAIGHEPRILRLPLAVEAQHSVGRRFRIAPLASLLDADDAFLIATATHDGAQLFSATRAGLGELIDAGLPDGSADDGVENDYENPVQASPPLRPNTGHAAISNAQVYGDAPPEWRETRQNDHAQAIVQAIGAATSDRRERRVLVAGAEMLGLLRPSGLFAADVEHNPDALSPDELHARALDAIAPGLDAQRARAVDEISAALGRGDGTASSDPAELLTASLEGRVGTLVLTPSALAGQDDTLDELFGAALTTAARIVVTADDVAPAAISGQLRY